MRVRDGGKENGNYCLGFGFKVGIIVSLKQNRRWGIWGVLV